MDGDGEKRAQDAELGGCLTACGGAVRTADLLQISLDARQQGLESRRDERVFGAPAANGLLAVHRSWPGPEQRPEASRCPPGGWLSTSAEAHAAESKRRMCLDIFCDK